MKIHGKQVLAGLLAAAFLAGQAGGAGPFGRGPSVVYADERAATVNGDILNVRSAPGTGSPLVTRLTYGTAVTVIGEEHASDGVVWYRIRFTSGAQTQEGYVSSQYIKFPVVYSADADFEAYLNEQRFPESYKASLRVLHAEHPSWVFQAEHTGLDWAEVIDNESMVGANLVDKNSISSWKSTEYGAYDWNTGSWPGFDGASWVAASRDIVCYYMDPRNFLDDSYVFQFLLHTYDGANQTRDGLLTMIAGTFLEGSANSGAGSRQSEVNDPTVTVNPSASGSKNVGPGYESAPEPQEYGPGYTEVSETQAQNEGNSQETAAVGLSSPPGTETGDGQNDGGVSLEGPIAPVAQSVPGKYSVRQASLTVGLEYGPGMYSEDMPESGNTPPAQNPNGSAPMPQGQSYADILMDAAAKSGVNPYVLAAMILQEQGEGNSRSISGKASGYEGYYNFFNVGAYASNSMDPVTRGLWFASQSGSYLRPWNSIESSILGGAEYYGENFVRAGQDTFYLKKFNVQGTNLYKHQYMTNVQAAAGEGYKLATAYTDTMKTQALVFRIPIFNNMPDTACAKPTADGSPNNKLASLSVEGYALTPTFDKDKESYDVIVNPSVERIAVSASAIDSKASVSGTGTVSLQSGANVVNIEVRAENGNMRTYRLNIVRQDGAPAVNVSDPGGPGSSAVNTNGGSGNNSNSNNNNSNNNTNTESFGPGMSGGPGTEGSRQSQSAESGAQNQGQTAGPGAQGQAMTQEQSGTQDQTAVQVQPPAQSSGQSDVQVGIAPV